MWNLFIDLHKTPYTIFALFNIIIKSILKILCGVYTDITRIFTWTWYKKGRRIYLTFLKMLFDFMLRFARFLLNLYKQFTLYWVLRIQCNFYLTIEYSFRRLFAWSEIIRYKSCRNTIARKWKMPYRYARRIIWQSCRERAELLLAALCVYEASDWGCWELLLCRSPEGVSIVIATALSGAIH